MICRIFSRVLITRTAALVCCAALILAFAQSAQAERADSIKLLPRSTFLYISIDDAPEMADKFMQTGFGQMLQDEQLAPIMGQVFEEIERLAEPMKDEIGLSLSDLLAIPQGEVTFALVDQGEGMDPGIVILADVHEQMLAVQQILDRANEEFSAGDRSRVVEEFGGVEITSYVMPGDSDLVYFEQDGTFVVTGSLAIARDLLVTWETGRSDAFNTNRQFATVVDRSRGPRGERPQITWFFDLMTLINSQIGDNPFAEDMISSMGLNGLKCFGGSILFATEDYDSISHVHIIMDHPRPGILNVLAFEPGDGTPDPWVTRESSAYMGINFNFQDAYDTLARFINGLPFTPEGYLEDQTQDAFENLGLDFEKEIYPAIGNRFAYSQWVQKPVTLSSQGQVFGIKLANASAFQSTFDKVVERFEDNLEEERFAGKTYYRMDLGIPQPDPEDEAPFGATPPSPCFMILNDYLLVSDRTLGLEEAIRASRGDVPSLDGDPDFERLMDIARRESGGEPAMIGFSRPSEGLGFMYNLVNSDSSRDDLRQLSEDNEGLAGFSRILDENALPSFSQLEKYLAPSGGILISDETGLHYTAYGLKTEAAEDAQDSGDGR